MSSATIFRQIHPRLGGGAPLERARQIVNANQLLTQTSRACTGDVSSGVPYDTLKNENQDMAKEVPAHADAVIVGGGIIGKKTGILWNLI